MGILELDAGTRRSRDHGNSGEELQLRLEGDLSVPDEGYALAAEKLSGKTRRSAKILDGDHDQRSPSSPRSRRNTRLVARYTALTLTPNSAATSAAGRSRTTCSQHAFHVAG